MAFFNELPKNEGFIKLLRKQVTLSVYVSGMVYHAKQGNTEYVKMLSHKCLGYVACLNDVPFRRHEDIVTLYGGVWRTYELCLKECHKHKKA